MKSACPYRCHKIVLRYIYYLCFLRIFITSKFTAKFCCCSVVFIARRSGAEVAGWTLDRKIRVRFPAYPHRVWALWWQWGKRRLRTSRCPCRGRLGTLKTPSCPWRGCPEAGQNLETGHLSRHYIAEISLNVTLNHNQQQQQNNVVFIRTFFTNRLSFKCMHFSMHKYEEWEDWSQKLGDCSYLNWPS